MKYRYSKTASLVQQLTWCRHRLWRWRARAFLPMLWLVASCALIHPKPSDTCAAGDAICQPGNSAIVCQGGKYVKTSCGGPRGCAMAPDRTVSCDQTSGAHALDACLPGYEGHSECLPTEAQSYLSCRDGTWVKLACPVGSCVVSGGNVACR